MFLLEALYRAAVKLERRIALITITETISRVAKVMWDVECAGIRADWLDKLIKEIHKERGCHELATKLRLERGR